VALGQREIQRVLWSLRPPLAIAADRAGMVRCVDELAAWAFEQELDALRHARLDGRLFAS